MGVVLRLQSDVHIESVENALIRLILVSNTIGMPGKSSLVQLENAMRLENMQFGFLKTVKQHCVQHRLRPVKTTMVFGITSSYSGLSSTVIIGCLNRSIAVSYHLIELSPSIGIAIWKPRLHAAVSATPLLERDNPLLWLSSFFLVCVFVSIQTNSPFVCPPKKLLGAGSTPALFHEAFRAG